LNIDLAKRFIVGNWPNTYRRPPKFQNLPNISEALARARRLCDDQLERLSVVASWQIVKTLARMTRILWGFRVVAKLRNSMQPVERSLEKLIIAYLPMLIESIPLSLARLISESSWRTGCKGHHWLRSLRSAF